MTNDEMNLRLTDLVGRIGRGTKVCITEFDLGERELIGVNVYSEDMPIVTCKTDRGLINMPLKFVKPYLLPLSSMNDEQLRKWIVLYNQTSGDNFCNVNAAKYIDWLNAHHFDFRGLIAKDLAIDATNLNIY